MPPQGSQKGGSVVCWQMRKPKRSNVSLRQQGPVAPPHCQPRQPEKRQRCLLSIKVAIGKALTGYAAKVSCDATSLPAVAARKESAVFGQQAVHSNPHSCASIRALALKSALVHFDSHSGHSLWFPHHAAGTLGAPADHTGTAQPIAGLHCSAGGLEAPSLSLHFAVHCLGLF